MKFWRGLEDLRGLVAVPAGWRARLDGEFEAVRGVFLRARPGVLARAVPCPRECGCAHEVIRHPDGRLVGVCRCESWNCEDLPLREEELVLWELNWSALGRALATALACEPQESVLGVPGVRQLGSCAGAPVLLSIQHEPVEFRSALAELALRLPEGFLVLSPSGRFVDARARELLAHARAGFADLESHLALLPGGKLQARQTAAELFRRRNAECGVRNAKTARRRGEVEAANVPSAEHAPRSTLDGPSRRYVLRKQLGVWHLVFEGQEALLQEDRGLALVAYLLKHPPEEPIHATVLEAQVDGTPLGAVGSVANARAGGAATVERTAVLQEASGSRLSGGPGVLLQRKLRELKAEMEDETLPASEREEAEAEYGELLRAAGRGGKLLDAAGRSAERVRKAIKRLLDALKQSELRPGVPDPTLRAFAAHLEQQLWVPSVGMAGGPGGRRGALGAPGRFIYLPPAGVVWR